MELQAEQRCVAHFVRFTEGDDNEVNSPGVPAAVAISPSISNSFAETISRTIDYWSS